jgi:aspartate 1-decarboxylase
MFRTLLKAKIHRAVVTQPDLHYEGSITIDADLLKASGILPYERVQVVDVENGARMETYVIVGPAGSGVIQMNGPAARLVNVGDHTIIMAYAQAAEPVPDDWEPTVVLIGAGNQVKQILTGRDAQTCAGC